MKKRVLIPLLAVCLLAALLPAAALAATANSIAYYDWSDSEKKLVPKTCPAATVVSSGDTAWGTEGKTSWYVVNQNVTFDQRISVSGNVHLILADGCTLEAKLGIRVADDDDDYTNGSPNALTIYGQTNQTGKLTVKGLSRSSHAAIGGNMAISDEQPAESGGTITINGGIIDVSANNGAGIGGGGGIHIMNQSISAKERGAAGGDITINGGTVKASSSSGAGIGGGCGAQGQLGGAGGKIVIRGGVVDASTNNSGAGIGGGGTYGEGGAGGTVIISGGIVTASSGTTQGIGCGKGGTDSGSFGTTSDGNAVIFASSIQDQSNKDNWRGIIFVGNDGKVYGSSVTPGYDFTIGGGKTLTIDSGNTLVNSHIIHVKGTVVNNGTVTNTGKIYVDGTFTGTADNLYYPLTLVKATAPNDIFSVYNGKNYVEVGTAGIRLTYDAPAAGYAFDSWSVSPEGEESIAANNTFTMPQKAITITALYKDVAAPVISGIVDGETYCTPQTVTVTDNDTIKSVTVNGEPVTLGSDGTFTLTVKDVDQVIVATDKTGNRVEVTAKSGHSNLGHEPARDATVTDTGNIEYWYCKDCKQYFADAECKNAITQDKTIVGKLPPEIIAGMGQSVLVGEKKALSFTSNAAYSDFIRVEIEGAGLDSSLYTVREGSTIVTLSADFVAGLSAGEYTIGIVSDGGTAKTTFAVTVQLPQTGDSSRIALWLMLLLLSGGVLAGVRCKKRSA